MKIGISIGLMAMSSYCALQVLIAGITYGDMYGIKVVAHDAAQIRHRGLRFFWACALLQLLNCLLLTSLFRRRYEGSSGIPRVHLAILFLLALVTSILGTGAGFGLLVWILRL